MTTEGLDKGSSGIHSRRKEDVKAKDIKKQRSEEELNRKLAEIKV